MAVLLEYSFPGLHHLGGGKVLDICDLGGALRIVATDRISVWDNILEVSSFCGRWLVDPEGPLQSF